MRGPDEASPQAIQATGRLRALAVSTPASLELLPGIPTINEVLVGFETSAFAGLGAPADLKIKVRILDLGGVPMPMTPAEFGRFLAAETEKCAKVIRAADIKPG